MKALLPTRDLLESFPGFSQTVAEIFVAETGRDMTQFATPQQLASWAGGLPGLQRIRRPGQVHQDPTGKPLPQRSSRRRRTEPGPNEENLALREMPSPGIQPRTHEALRRRRTRDAHRRVAHARRRPHPGCPGRGGWPLPRLADCLGSQQGSAPNRGRRPGKIPWQPTPSHLT